MFSVLEEECIDICWPVYQSGYNETLNFGSAKKKKKVQEREEQGVENVFYT